MQTYRNVQVYHRNYVFVLTCFQTFIRSAPFKTAREAAFHADVVKHYFRRRFGLVNRTTEPSLPVPEWEAIAIARHHRLDDLRQWQRCLEPAAGKFVKDNLDALDEYAASYGKFGPGEFEKMLAATKPEPEQ